MSKDRSDELHSALDTARLLEDVEIMEGEAYSLGAILAEFGRGGAEPAQKRETEETAQEMQPSAQEMTAPQEETTTPQEEITAPVEESISAEAPTEPAEKATAPERAEIIMDRDPGEPEGNINDVPLTRIMSETVEAVLEENDEILEVQPTWRERLAERFAAVKERRPAKEPTIEDTGSCGIIRKRKRKPNRRSRRSRSRTWNRRIMTKSSA